MKKLLLLSLLLVSTSLIEARKKNDCCPTNGTNVCDTTKTNCDIGHPLDPLSCQEIQAVGDFVKANPATSPITSRTFVVFTDIILKEPKKACVKFFEANGGSFLRQAQVILYDNSTAEAWEVIVNVCGPDNLSLDSVNKLCPGTIPNMNRINDRNGSTPYGNPTWFPQDEVNAIVKATPELVQALASAYSTDVATVNGWIDTGILLPIFYIFESFRTDEKRSCCPETITKGMPKHRYGPLVFLDTRQKDPFSAEFWSIVNGVEAVFDVTDKKIVAVITPNPQAVPVLEPYDIPCFNRAQPLQPLYTIMPNGNSFTRDGYEVTWDNWKFRISWHTHAGVQLYNIKYFDCNLQTDEFDGYRSMLYKISLTDAMVTYNTGTDILFSRNYLSGDAFHYPWLRRFTNICLGRDVPEYAELLDIFLADTNGNAAVLPRTIAIYEQDGDLLWRTPTTSGLQADLPVDGARGRQLVVRSIFAGSFYLWVVSWIFQQDGSMTALVDVGGRTQNILVPKGAELPSAELITPQEAALYHTHIYNYRMDFDVDGEANTVVETNFLPINDRKTNPCGQAVNVEETVLQTEKEAIRDLNIETNRSWRVINPNVQNLTVPSHNTGLGLVPLANGTVNNACYSNLKQQFKFVNHHIHVTRYHDDEQFAAGDMPILQDHDTGLGAYVKNDENIENKDIVLWYTINFAHDPITEDYPWISMPPHRQGFSIVPQNFFGANPAFAVVNPDVIDSLGNTLNPARPADCCTFPATNAISLDPAGPFNCDNFPSCPSNDPGVTPECATCIPNAAAKSKANVVAKPTASAPVKSDKKK